MMNEILEHLKKDKLFVETYYNYEPDLIAIIKYYYYEKLGWCGCGMPGNAMRTVAKYLQVHSLQYPENVEKRKELFGVKWDEDNPLLLCLAYALDNAGFTEHGTSIGSAWLTDDGKYFLWAIQEAEKQDDLDI